MAKLSLVAAIAGVLVAASPTLAAPVSAESTLVALRDSTGLTGSSSTLTADPAGDQLISDKKRSSKKKRKQKGKNKKNKKSDDNKSSKSKSSSKSDSHDSKDDHNDDRKGGSSSHANDPSHT